MKKTEERGWNFMKYCEKCGKDCCDTLMFCDSCGAELLDENSNLNKIPETKNSKKRSIKKILIPVLCVVLAIIIVAVAVIVPHSKPYEEVAKKYVSAATSDLLQCHTYTIYDEQAYDSALVQYSKKLESVNDLYLYLSENYFSMGQKTYDYYDFYEAYSKKIIDNTFLSEIKCSVIHSTEMSEQQLMEEKEIIESYQTSYSEKHPLSSDAIIDTENIEQGYYVVVNTSLGKEEDGFESPVTVLKYNDNWYVTANQCLKELVGDEIYHLDIMKSDIEEYILEAELNKQYYKAGPFSIKYTEVLNECVPDCEIEYFKYEDAKSQYLSEEEITSVEEKYNLENAYFAVATGCIMNNPDVPYMLSDEKVIFNLLLIFDENDEYNTGLRISECDEFYTCAIILATDF